MIKRMESLQNQSSANEEADIYSVAVLDSGRRVLVLEMQKYTMELEVIKVGCSRAGRTADALFFQSI